MEEAPDEFEEKLPGFAQVMEPDSPGMHTSDSADVVLIVSGQAILELADGAQVTLSAGDCVVPPGSGTPWYHSEGCELVGRDLARHGHRHRLLPRLLAAAYSPRLKP